MNRFINNYLEFLSPLLVLLSMAHCRHGWKHRKEIRILFVYFLVFTLIIGRTTWLARFNINNTAWYALHEGISLLLLSFFIYSAVDTPTCKRQVLGVSVTGISLFIILFFAWYEPGIFFSAGHALGGILVVCCCNLYLIDFFCRDEIKTPSPVFWIVCALLVYHIGSVLIHGSYKYLTRLNLLHRQNSQLLQISTLWGIQNVMLCASCCLIAVSIYRFRQLQEIPN